MFPGDRFFPPLVSPSRVIISGRRDNAVDGRVGTKFRCVSLRSGLPTAPVRFSAIAPHEYVIPVLRARARNGKANETAERSRRCFNETAVNRWNRWTNEETTTIFYAGVGQC